MEKLTAKMIRVKVILEEVEIELDPNSHVSLDSQIDDALTTNLDWHETSDTILFVAGSEYADKVNYVRKSGEFIRLKEQGKESYED